jgi:hypothetical protein
MKKLNTLLAVLIISLSANAKIWRVNNNSGITADFTTAQAAHDAATAGDTLHFEPSGTSYGNLTVTKRLVLVSSGAYITENPGYQTQSNTGYLSTITLSNTGANGSVIMVKFIGDINLSNNVGNILIQNCATNYFDPLFCCGRAGIININNSDNIIIKNCFVNNINFISNSNNIIVTNNIIYNSIGNDASSDGLIANNVICAGYFTTLYSYFSLFNCTVENNIFNYLSTTFSFSSCLVRNNIAGGAFLPTGNGNQNGVTMTNVFVNRAGGYLDNVYQLKAGSPALAAGTGGVDCGAFGGATPFKLAVTPPIPSIYKLEVPSTPAGNTMNIKFSTRSNN